VNRLLLASLLLAMAPAALLAQDAIPEGFQDPVPANLAPQEIERSRQCVPVLTRLAELDQELAPLSQRVERIRALDGAVGLEDRLRVAPFAEDDPIEAQVREWFDADAALAERYLETGDESIQEERQAGREGIREVLRDEFLRLNEEAQEVFAGEDDIEARFIHCEGAVFVRSAVIEACGSTSSPICDDARRSAADDPTSLDAGQDGHFQFVENPEDLWDLEYIRPWTPPSVLQPTPDGLAGARTAALTRRGNITFIFSLEPLIRQRSSLSDAEAQDFEAHLASMGFEFDHPDFIMAPALGVDLDVGGPLGTENAYVLHFGDLSDPENQIIWTREVGVGGPVQEILAVEWEVLQRLAQGEEVSFTAIRLPTSETDDGEAIFSLPVPMVNQAEAVSTLLQYMREGQLSEHLNFFFPPEGAAEQG
jgi:hypothetical protein